MPSSVSTSWSPSASPKMPALIYQPESAATAKRFGSSGITASMTRLNIQPKQEAHFVASLFNWLGKIGVIPSDIWPPEVPERERTLWNARVFPALQEHQDFRNWLWLLNVEPATPAQKRSFLAADRYSSSEIAIRVDQTQFLLRRSWIQSARMPHDDRGRTQAQSHVVDC